MAFVAATKMCVLIYLFAWLTSAELLHYPKYQNLFCRLTRREPIIARPREANADAAQDIYLLYYRAITENRCRRGIETAYRA